MDEVGGQHDMFRCQLDGIGGHMNMSGDQCDCVGCHCYMLGGHMMMLDVLVTCISLENLACRPYQHIVQPYRQDERSQ